MAYNVVIRKALPGEYEAIGRLTLEAYQGLAGFSDPDGYSQVLLDAEGRAREAEVFVALLGETLLGGVTYVGESTSALSEWDDPDAAGIRMLAVNREAQGRGVGRLLTEYCVARAAASGKSTLLLHSTPFMDAAHKLYGSMGFRRYPAIDFEVDTVKLLGFRLAL